MSAVELRAVGDIGLNAAVGDLIRREGASRLFAEVQPLLSACDLLFGNLEMPFAPEGLSPAWPEVLDSFRSDPAHAPALAAAGFGILSVANNHIMDFGAEGLRATLEALRRAGVAAVGAGGDLGAARAPVVLERRGLRIGFLAYAQPGRHCAAPGRAGAAPLEESLAREDIHSLKARADLIVVSLHFGMVYSDYPAPGDRALALRLLEAGAHLVLGHHPHVPQGVERRGSRLAAYSLGEFVFDPSCGHVTSRVAAEARRRSLVLSCRLSAEGVIDHALLPVESGGDLRPRALQGEPAREALARLEALGSGIVSGGADLFMDQLASRTVRHQRDVLLHHLRRGHFGILARWFARVRPRHVAMLLRSLRTPKGAGGPEPSRRRG
jgi:capsule synthesis protein PGA_cap